LVATSSQLEHRDGVLGPHAELISHDAEAIEGELFGGVRAVLSRIACVSARTALTPVRGLAEVGTGDETASEDSLPHRQQRRCK
jgi:hypothetical protein